MEHQIGIQDNAIKDRRAFVQGSPDMILLHERPQVKYPTEIAACDLAFDPNNLKYAPTPKRRAPDYVPPSIRPDEAWCSGCRQWHMASEFHKDRSRPNGLKAWCIEYRAVQRKLSTHKKQVSDYWYRAPRK